MVSVAVGAVLWGFHPCLFYTWELIFFLSVFPPVILNQSPYRYQGEQDMGDSLIVRELSL